MELIGERCVIVIAERRRDGDRDGAPYHTDLDARPAHQRHHLFLGGVRVPRRRARLLQVAPVPRALTILLVFIICSRDRIHTVHILYSTVSRSQKFYRQQMLKLTAESPVPLEEANEEQPIASPVLAAALPPSSSGVTIGTSSSTNSASKRVRTFSGDMVASPVSYAPSNSWASRERDLNRPPPPPKSPPPTLSLDETTLSSKQQSVRPSITRQLSRQQSVAVFDDDGVLVPEPVRLLRSSVSRLLYL